MSTVTPDGVLELCRCHVSEACVEVTARLVAADRASYVLGLDASELRAKAARIAEIHRQCQDEQQ